MTGYYAAYRVVLDVQAQMVLDAIVREHRMARLRAQIDEALDRKDIATFTVLREELRTHMYEEV